MSRSYEVVQKERVGSSYFTIGHHDYEYNVVLKENGVVYPDRLEATFHGSEASRHATEYALWKNAREDSEDKIQYTSSFDATSSFDRPRSDVLSDIAEAERDMRGRYKTTDHNVISIILRVLRRLASR